MINKNYSIPSIVYFVITAILIAYLFPGEAAFRYQFQQGKPWRYGLLTATNDFPIYKTADEIKTEKDSVMSQFRPYYRLDPSIRKTKLEKLEKDYARQKESYNYIRYVNSTLSNLYNKGIVSIEALDYAQSSLFEKVNLLKENIATPYYLSDFFTARTAYEFVINNCPKHLDKQKLQSLNINNYITENVVIDTLMNQRIRSELLQNISISEGVIQAGEKIIDKGEIVNAHTYRVLSSLKKVYESKIGGNKRETLILGGEFILILSFILCGWYYLFAFREEYLKKNKDIFFILLCILTTTILNELAIRYSLFNIYILPFAIVPIVLRTFFDSRTAMFTHLIIVSINSLMVPLPYEFLLMQTMAGMVAIFSLRQLTQRSQLIQCSIFIFIAYVLCYLSIILYQTGNINKINWMMMLYLGINFILTTFAYLLIYMIEKLFGYVTDITLVELTIGSPILKKLSVVCQGTFHHSNNVSNLAAAAAAVVGANEQLVRTGAMFHDIGKMKNPTFFIENQQNINPHDKLSYKESAKIIIDHVDEGVAIAKKANLPEQIIDFIKTHHGKSLAKYFYNSYVNEHPDLEIDSNDFRYKGPNPSTKETAILMMADSIEAASRSLTTHTDESISNVVDKIIESQIEGGLMQNTPLTFKDIENIKNVFKEELKTMYHTRISYPDLKN